MIQKINRYSSLILCLGWIGLGCSGIYLFKSGKSILSGIVLIVIGVIYGIYYFSRKKI